MKRWTSVCLIFSVLVNALLFTVGGYYFYRHNTAKAKDATAYSNKVSLYSALSQNTTDVVFVGDSITAGCEWAEFFPGSVNRGIGGDTTTGVLNRLQAITDTKPRKIFIMIGTNDFVKGRCVPEIVASYKQIINIVKQQSPGTKIYVQSVLPVSEKYSKRNNDIIVLNEELKKLAPTYIDLYSAFLKNQAINPKYTVDGTHLTPEGYLLWKGVIDKYVTK